MEARLLRVARREFVAKGYGAASMNEVAKTARVSKGTLYARFPSKAELFWAIVDEQIQNTGGWVRYRGPRPKSLEAMLRIFAERALHDSLDAEIVPLNRLVYSEAARFPELGQAARARWHIGVNQVSGIIRDYASVDGVPCRDPQVVAEMFIALLMGYCGDVMLRNATASTAEIKAWTRRMLGIFLAGRSGW